MSRQVSLLALACATAAFAEGTPCGRDVDCPGEEICSQARCVRPASAPLSAPDLAPGTPSLPPAPLPPQATPTAPPPVSAPPPFFAPVPQAPCERVWIRVTDAPPQVRWCNRSIPADDLLVPEAAPLFAASTPAREAFDAALGARSRAEVAATLAVGALGLSVATMIGALPGFRVEGPASVAIGIAGLVVMLGGSVAALIVHGFASNEALTLLEKAVKAVGGSSFTGVPGTP